MFPNVRQFEQFTRLELGLVAETKRKSLPRLAQTTKADPQAFHHFLAEADWSVEALRAVRLELTRQALRERPFILCLDETGDRKKGKTTDYAAHQYIGNVHTLANGVVSVNAYGVLDTVTFPLAFRIYKPQRRLKPGDVYKSKPQLAVELIQELAAQGFHFTWCSPTACMARAGTSSRRCIAWGCRMWWRSAPTTASGRFPASACARRAGAPSTASSPTARSERRYRCEFVFGKRTRTRYFVITTDPVHLPPETTWHLMTNLPGKIEQTVGNTFGLRTWIEYGFKHAKDELGWADYRLTDAHSIERWWELVMCAYLLVSLQAPALAAAPARLRAAAAAVRHRPARR